MCDVVDFGTGKTIATTMSVQEAEELVGEGLMTDELHSTKELCAGDDQVELACGVLLSIKECSNGT